MSLSKGELETLYRKESRAGLKERLLLVLKVEGDGMIAARVAKELHRSRTWTSDWLARYHNEGIDGLENRPKSGRPSKLSEEVAVKVRKKLKERRKTGVDYTAGKRNNSKRRKCTLPSNLYLYIAS